MTPLSRAGIQSHWAGVAITLVGLCAAMGLQAEPVSDPTPARLMLDMLHKNPGEGYPASAFGSPRFLSSWGYNGEVAGSIAGIQTFDELVPGLLPEGSPEREWALQRAADLRLKVKAAHAAGLKCFAGTDMFLLPKKLIETRRAEICDARGRLDIARPAMQEVFRAFLRETFQRVPDLDGIVVRTGEVYLQGYPYHAASGNFSEGKTQGASAILNAEASHIQLLHILRDEVCVRQNKTLIYRTWSFNGFHISPEYYLKVTDAIEPHPNLLFSIKHQKGDFHQLTVFNPTLMIGRHRQIIEVQCQREAYGKGAHPYYIGDGVINGWEEYAWLMKPGQPRGLRDVIANPLCAGVWTWSRGGGWEGPFIKNELWCELNAYVISRFAENPTRTEAEVFNEYAREKLKLQGGDVEKFRELNLLSAKAVLRGQLTTLGARINLWWARDHFFEEPDLSDFIKKGLVEKALAEKAESVAMWRRMEALAREIHFADPSTQEFVEVSAAYGRIKYEIIQQAWTVLFEGKAGDKSGHYDREKISAAIARYDALWKEWRELAGNHDCCATICKDAGFEYKPGLGAAINRYRKICDAASQSAAIIQPIKRGAYIANDHEISS